ncbi:MAG TPA: hydroxymethylbilane synthase [Candidatus Udaeobacter sp.]|jgi:hydroxymethylbilane synthase|nr:hydroxymethylbilane synthase [Candidatus Udaeobacter sp.]
MTRKIILGTRGSELARAQARLVEKAIQAAQPDAKIETRIITTRGDKARILERQAGRKGLFTAEIEQALLAGNVDVAVHSAKDLPSETNPDAEISAVLPRGPMDDVLVSKHPGGFASLPHSGTVATGSVRRKRQLLWKRADLKLVDLRGNVPTRLRKLTNNNWDAIVLARAGLARLSLSPAHHELSFEGRQLSIEVLPPDVFLPAGGQGIIALQVRANDETVKAIVDLVNDHKTLLCLRAEREFLRLLHGDCNCPVGVLATIEGDKMKLRAQLFTDQSAAPQEAEVEGVHNERERLAVQLLNRLQAPAFEQGYGLPG